MEFRARLNQTSSREEAVPIFKDAVVELDKYGLLPSGMSVERVQKLITDKSTTRDPIDTPVDHNILSEHENNRYIHASRIR